MRIRERIRLSGVWFIFVFWYLLYKTSTKTHVIPFEFKASSLFTFLLSVLFLYSLVELILRSLKISWFQRGLLSFLVSLYAILGFYHYKTTSYFDFSIIADHWLSIWRVGSFRESLKVINGVFGTADYVRTGLAGVVMYVLVGYDLRSSKKKSVAPVLGFAASFLYLLFLTPNPVDELSSLSKSAMYRVFSLQTQFQLKYKPKADQPLPLAQHFVAKHGSEKPPHIFFIFIESVNARFIETTAPQGKEYTPFFNSLIPEGMYFEKFYASSIQTGRSHFASLCGLTPSIYGKEFERFVDRKLNCLPEILREKGYFTVFSKANEDVHFDNTYSFTTSHGFKTMNSMGRGCKGADKDLCWGWGIQDDEFYRRFFKYLEREHKEGPLFATLATISSHMPFNEVPKDQRYIFKNPKNRVEHYSNALRVTDEYLKTFISELKKSPYSDNAIVFLMGDHSFPMGEHDNFQNEIFAFEENFRTPLLILDYRKNRVVPKTRVPTAYSQVNLPSTVLDLAGISTYASFQGESLLGAPPSFIHLVQPYGGIYFSVIKYPLKYVFYDRTEKEFMFNLEQDPKEERNLLQDGNLDSAMLDEFRREVGKVWLNYDMMVQDRVWDARVSVLAN